MPYKFIIVPVLDGGEFELELNRFLASNRVLGVQKSLVTQDGCQYWAFCVDYRLGGSGNEHGAAGSGSGSSPGRRKEGRDPREWLPPETHQDYERLRKKRLELAKSTGVAAYAVFTNRQLGEIVLRRVRTLEGLKGLTGITDAQLSTYAERFLTELQATFQDDGHATNGQPLPTDRGVGEPATRAVESAQGQA